MFKVSKDKHHEARRLTTSEGESHGREEAVIRGIARDYRRILQPLHPRLLAVYKAEFYKSFLQNPWHLRA